MTKEDGSRKRQREEETQTTTQSSEKITPISDSVEEIVESGLEQPSTEPKLLSAQASSSFPLERQNAFIIRHPANLDDVAEIDSDASTDVVEVDDSRSPTPSVRDANSSSLDQSDSQTPSTQGHQP